LKGNEWKKAAYVLARGGRFEDYDVAYLPFGEPEWVTHRIGNSKNVVQLYNETVALTHNAITGERFDGCLRLEPPKNMKGQPIYEIYSRKEYPFLLSTYKVPIHSKSRTICRPMVIRAVAWKLP